MRFFLNSIICLLAMSCLAQNQVQKVVQKEQSQFEVDRPKLVVGIVVDQMRYDYLTRFKDRFGEGGFNRLISEGFNCKNNHFNYIPTKTGPGHASIFSGTTPKNHGIIGNDWYDKGLRKWVNCVGDDSVNSLGTETTYGKRSPHRLKSSTLTDENRLFSQLKGKTIGVAIKDRGAIIPAGHTANAAYWFQGKDEGKFISSTFYLDALPKWVEEFNSSDQVESYLKIWNTLYPIEGYVESGSDLNDFEGGFNGKETATFPYDLKTLKDENNGYDIIPESPFGNSLTTDFAIAAIHGESLGNDNFTDFLTISYSSTDKVGHNFGVNSKEVQDTYLRLDKDLENLLSVLDNKVGEDQYVVFLTADHGAPYAPNYMKSVKVPAGLFDFKLLHSELNKRLQKKYEYFNLIETVSNEQIFINYETLSISNIDIEDLKQTIIEETLKFDLVDKVYDAKKMQYSKFENGIELLLQNGYNQKRSGDILIVLNPSVFNDTPWNRTGTNHMSGYSYDTHVPLIFYGAGINQGSTLVRTEITDIAPTISALLNISFPNSSTGNPISSVIEED